jgi:WD40 repeat protein
MTRSPVFFVAAVLAWPILTPALQAQPRVDALGDPLPDGAIARLGTTRMRHSSTPDHYCWGVGCITWSPDGKMIATTSYADQIGVEARLWEASTGKPLSVLENNKRYGPSFVRFTPDSKTLAAAARDRIVLWDVATGKEQGQLVGHRGDVDALIFRDGGKTVVSVSRDGAVRWWDVAGRKTLREWQLLVNEPKKTDKGEPILFRGVRHACFSADGKALALEKWWATQPDTQYPENIAVVFDLSARKEVWREDSEAYPCGFAFSPDGKRLAVSRAAFFTLRDAATGRRLTGPQYHLAWGMDFSPDGKTLALRKSGGITLWSNEETPARQFSVPHHNGCSRTPAFSPDGRRVAVEIARTFQVLDVATGKPALSWPGYDRGFGELAFSADGRNLFESDNELSIDTARWHERASSADPLRKRFGGRQNVSVDRTLCVARDGEHPDTLFDTRTGRVVARLKAPEREAGLHQGFFSPRATLYVMQDRSCARTEVDTLFAIPSGKRLCQFSFDGHVGTSCWSFSADESRVAFVELRPGTIRVHETATGKLLRRFAAGAREVSLAVSPDGNLLAVWKPGSRKVEILELQRGQHSRWLELNQKAKERDHACLAWSPDNRMLAVGGLGDSVRLWEVASGEVRREFRGHEGQATCLAFSREGRVLASGSEDTTLLIWKTRPGK